MLASSWGIMKTKLLYTFFAILVLSGVTTSIYFGLKPRPILIIGLSGFDSPKKLAQSIQLRMRQEIHEAPILLLGFQPERPGQIQAVLEFLRTNTEAGYAYDTQVIEENFPPEIQALFPTAEKINAKEKIQDLAMALQSAHQQGRRVVVILPSMYTSQMLQQSVADQLKKKFQVPILSFSFVELIRSRENEKSVAIPCYVTEADPTGAGRLGCAILQQSRLHYRKKLSPGKNAALMDQRGSRDFLIFYSENAEPSSISQ